ncbi:MAG: ABC transporter substrate-binding protein [Tissierellia bacterium]|nr:ABC transporter substrate-binding protein [Tissierellia bacterium]
MNKTKKLISLLLIIVLSFTLVACGDTKVVEEEKEVVEGTNEEVVKEKPYEGTVLEVSVAYGGADASFEAFTEETGIEIEWVSMSTGAKLSQLQAEEGKTTTDIWFGGGVDSYINARELGYLHQYNSPEYANIDDKYIDSEGYYGALAIVPHGIIINNDLIEELGLDIPETWEDLTDPQYKGEIIMADPSISGGQYAIHSGLLQHMGEEAGWAFWEAIDKNVDYYGQSGGEPGQKVAEGEFAIGLTAITGGTFGLAETAPVTPVFLDSVPWIPAPIAIFENSQNKDAAKVFVDWYVSDHGQTILKDADARIMANRNVEPPADLAAILDMDKLIDFDLVKMGSDRESTLARWAEIIGE